MVNISDAKNYTFYYNGTKYQSNDCSNSKCVVNGIEYNNIEYTAVFVDNNENLNNRQTLMGNILIDAGKVIILALIIIGLKKIYCKYKIKS